MEAVAAANQQRVEQQAAAIQQLRVGGMWLQRLLIAACLLPCWEAAGGATGGGHPGAQGG